MGMLFRALAPKPLKKARRAAHPVSAVTTPIKMPIKNAANPAGAAKRAAKREAVRELRGTTPRNESGLELFGILTNGWVLFGLLLIIGLVIIYWYIIVPVGIALVLLLALASHTSKSGSRGGAQVAR